VIRSRGSNSHCNKGLCERDDHLGDTWDLNRLIRRFTAWQIHSKRSDEAMAVFRLERNTGYTVKSKHDWRNKELSLKAKGPLVVKSGPARRIGTIPVRGCRTSTGQGSTLSAPPFGSLRKRGYITRREGRDEKGKMNAIEYTIYGQPQPPEMECPVAEIQQRITRYWESEHG
jgi:hypothetical protein